MEIQWDNPVVYCVAAFIYILLMVFVWKFPTWASVSIKEKVILSILGYPVFFLVANWKING